MRLLLHHKQKYFICSHHWATYQCKGNKCEVEYLKDFSVKYRKVEQKVQKRPVDQSKNASLTIFLTPEYIQGVKLTVRLKDDVSGRKGPAISFEIGRIAECSPKNILINKAVLLTVNPVIQSQLHPTYK